MAGKRDETKGEYRITKEYIPSDSGSSDEIGSQDSFSSRSQDESADLSMVESNSPGPDPQADYEPSSEEEQEEEEDREEEQAMEIDAEEEPEKEETLSQQSISQQPVKQKAKRKGRKQKGSKKKKGKKAGKDKSGKEEVEEEEQEESAIVVESVIPQASTDLPTEVVQAAELLTQHLTKVPPEDIENTIAHMAQKKPPAKFVEYDIAKDLESQKPGRCKLVYDINKKLAAKGIAPENRIGHVAEHFAFPAWKGSSIPGFEETAEKWEDTARNLQQPLLPRGAIAITRKS